MPSDAGSRSAITTEKLAASIVPRTFLRKWSSGCNRKAHGSVPHVSGCKTGGQAKYKYGEEEEGCGEGHQVNSGEAVELLESS